MFLNPTTLRIKKQLHRSLEHEVIRSYDFSYNNHFGLRQYVWLPIEPDVIRKRYIRGHFRNEGKSPKLNDDCWDDAIRRKCLQEAEWHDASLEMEEYLRNSQ
jgi:hypothetical protein